MGAAHRNRAHAVEIVGRRPYESNERTTLSIDFSHPSTSGGPYRNPQAITARRNVGDMRPRGTNCLRRTLIHSTGCSAHCANDQPVTGIEFRNGFDGRVGYPHVRAAQDDTRVGNSLN